MLVLMLVSFKEEFRKPLFDADFRGISVGGAMEVSHVQVRNLVCIRADIAGGVHGSNLACGSDAVFALARLGGIGLPQALKGRRDLAGLQYSASGVDVEFR